MVEPPFIHMGDITSGVPFAVVSSPRGEGGAPEGQDVLVLIIRVPYMKEKGEVG